jgi:hypothetical protein
MQFDLRKVFRQMSVAVTALRAAKMAGEGSGAIAKGGAL